VLLFVPFAMLGRSIFSPVAAASRMVRRIDVVGLGLGLGRERGGGGRGWVLGKGVDSAGWGRDGSPVRGEGVDIRLQAAMRVEVGREPPPERRSIRASLWLPRL
jgi:hypothetical protein